MTEATIVYIAGYGRSGSTLLNTILGSHPSVASLGEVGMLWKLVADGGAVCTCGETFAACPQWKPVLLGIGNGIALPTLDAAARQQENWVRGAVGGRKASAAIYGSFSMRFFDLLGDAGRARTFVDSSKTAYRFFWRPSALQRDAGLKVRMIHLVRDPRHVLASCMKGQNSRLAIGDATLRPMSAAIALAGWVIANVGALLNAARLGKENHLLVEYEKLVAAPTVELERLGRFLQLDLSPLLADIRDGVRFSAGHLVAGNRVAKAGFVFPQAPPQHTHALGFWQRLGCSVFAMPLLGYLRRRSAARERLA